MYGHGMNFSNWLCGNGVFSAGPFGMLLTILFWVILIVLVVRGLQYLFTSKSSNKQDSASSSLTILKNRYASGEISKTVFEQMKKDIA